MIHERRGLSLLKDIKKQLVSERRRADRLQDKFTQLLADPATIAGFTGQWGRLGGRAGLHCSNTGDVRVVVASAARTEVLLMALFGLCFYFTRLQRVT